MRVNTTEFDYFNSSDQKDLRLVVVIDFPTPLYLASHDDIPNIPVGALPHTIKNVSSNSQRLNPDVGRSELGTITFDVVDVNGGVSARFNTEQAAGNGLTHRKVEVYRGGAGMDWTDFRIEQTQQITQYIAYDKGGYKINCSDIQHEMRVDIFDTAKTTLAADFLQGATTLEVFNADDFEACQHVASFGDQPTGAYYYLKIKYENGFEIVRATGKTNTPSPRFTGITRGVFGTQDVDHIFPTGEDSDSSVEIEEYVYLELPAPAMAYALLTGQLPGGGTIPARWNLGIPTSAVDVDSFENIGTDWFDPLDYSSGFIIRFNGVTKTEGKRFIEREVMLLAGAFMYVRADGKVYMKRMTGILCGCDYVAEITPDVVVKHGPLKHNLARVRNIFDIEWSWIHFPEEDKPRYVRRNILVDGNSQAIHGTAHKPLKFKFKGLHNERHTFTTLRNRFDALRDRYAGPPLTIDVDLLPSMNDLEVGDFVRVFLPNVEDFVEGGHLDRTMEIQRITVNQQTGRIRASLFGSSLRAEPIVDDGAGGTSELPDGWYSSEGTDFATAGLSIDGFGVLQANGTLTGGTTTRTIYYYLGDFTIPAGLQLTCTGNVELRVRGTLQINGTLRASGGMPAGQSGFIGTTNGGRVYFSGRNPPGYPDYRGAPFYVRGRNEALPILEIENNAGVLEGIPADMRGTGGGAGRPVLHWNAIDVVWEQFGTGGTGGVGGGSIVAVSRGAGYGVSGVTRTSGTNGTAGTVSAGPPVNGVAAGSGGGGAPGAMVHLIDGSQVTFPILAGNVEAEYGISPIPSNGDEGACGKINPSAAPLDLGINNARVQYVPKSRDPYPDYTNDGLGSADGLSINNALIYQRAATAPATPAANDGQYNFDTGVLTPPTGWFTEPPSSDGNPLWVSTGQFTIQGQSGIDGTVVWTAPAELVSDGADGAAGAPGADGSDGNSVYYAQQFRRSAGAPATPTGGSYNFTTGVLTPSTGWSSVPPASDGNALYVSTAVAEINGVTGIDSTLTWSTPAELVNDGADGAPGSDGSDGQSVYVSNVYRRSATAPLTPSGGQYDFGTNTLTPPSLWSVEPPAGSDPLYVSTASWSVVGTTGVDTTGNWTAPALLVQDGNDGAPGADGADGINTRYPTIYRLNSNTISSTAGTFADPLAGNTGWSYSVPTMTADGDVVYAASRIFTSDGLAPQQANWSTPAVYATRVDGVDGINGNDGADGQGIRTVTAYRLNSSAYSTTAGSFADPLAGQTGWSYSIPALAADGDTVYVIVRTFTSDAAAPQDAAWTAPAIYSQRTDGAPGAPGADGADGNSVYYAQQFRRAATQPTTPTGGSYNFATQTLTPSAGWSVTPPASDGNPLWVTSAIAEAPAAGTDNTLAWATPADLVSDGADGATGTPGADGADGNSVYYIQVFQRSASAPATPTGGSYNFATQSLTPPAGWSATPPASDGNPLYVSTTIAEAAPNGTDSSLTWTTPQDLVSDGADGATGPAGSDGSSVHVSTIYQRSLTQPATPTGGQFVFGTNVLTPPSGWSATPPDDDGRPLWASTGVWSVSGPTGTDTTTTWTTPTRAVQGGQTGPVLTTRDWRTPLADPLSEVWDHLTGNIANSSITFSEAGPFDDLPATIQMRGDGLTNPGWYTAWRANFAYDNEKSYILYAWVKKVGPVSNGIYFGWPNVGAGSEVVQSVGGVPNTNPYFIANQGSIMAEDKWYLAVGIVWGLNSGITSQQGLGGLYDPETGVKIYSGQEFRWDTDQYDQAWARFGFYDNAAPPIPATDGVDFTRVTAWEMNGNEPSIGEVLSGGIGLPKSPIVAGVKKNYSTFTGSNPGEMYIHGLDRNGDPVDADGSMIIDGARVGLPKGYVYTNVATEGHGFIVVETGAGTPFAGASADSKKAGCQVIVTDGVVQWQYDNNSAWTNFTPTSTMYIIGIYDSGVDNILSASLIAPRPISSGVINAARIEADSLRAISATIGSLETRATGGSPTTPRLVLSDSASPLQIFDTDDLTSLLELTNTANGFRIGILGDFIANSIDSSQMFSETGISDLRGRLGLSDPSGSYFGGALTKSAGNKALTSSPILCNVLASDGVTVGDIDSGGNDVTLFWKTQYNDWGSGLPGFSAGNWTFQWQVSANGGAYSNIVGASWTVVGQLQVSGNGTSEPWEWFYSLNEEQSYIWTGAVATTNYTFRLVATLNSGTNVGSITVLTANEPITGGGVIEAHTHTLDEIDELAAAGITGIHATGDSAPGADQLVRTNTNGYIYAGWINTVSGARTTQAISRVYASDDSFLRYYTLANFAAQLDNQNMNFSGATFQRNSLGIPHYVTAGYASAKITVSGTAPGTPAQGDIWFDTAASVAANSISTAGGYTLAQSTAQYGGLNVGGTAKNGYYGIQLASELTFMWSGSVGGIYNHDGSDWVLQHTRLAGVRLYYANAVKLETLTGGVSITGNLDVSNGVDITGNLTVTGTLTRSGLGIPYYGTSTYTRARISVQTTAPTSPVKGDIWFDTS